MHKKLILVWTTFRKLAAMNSLGKFFRTMTYSNCTIALAAVAQCGLTYLILNLPFQPYILMIEGTSTLLLYNFSLFLSKPIDPVLSPFPRTRYFFAHETVMWAISILALLLLLYALAHIHAMTTLYLAFIGMLSLLYNIPFLSKGQMKFGLRQVPGLKLFYIAILWSLSTVGLPIVEAWGGQLPFDWAKAVFLSGIKVLFLVVCTLPFDIRDLTQDKLYRVKTIPVMIGRKRSIYLTYSLLIGHAVLALFAPYDMPIKVALLLTDLGVLLILNKVFQPLRANDITVYLLDVALILQFVVTAAIHTFFHQILVSASTPTVIA